jgi:hypothetical protein
MFNLIRSAILIDQKLTVATAAQLGRQEAGPAPGLPISIEVSHLKIRAEPFICSCGVLSASQRIGLFRVTWEFDDPEIGGWALAERLILIAAGASNILLTLDWRLQLAISTRTSNYSSVGCDVLSGAVLLILDQFLRRPRPGDE